MTWKKFNGETIESPILEEVEHAIERESALGNKLKVCIGTDSQVKGSIIDFATVIVFLREKKGGFMYIHQERSSVRMGLKNGCFLKSRNQLNVLIHFVICLIFMM